MEERMEEGGSEGKWERGGEGVEVMLLFWVGGGW